MENRGQFIMNDNDVLFSAVFLDPRFKITLNEIQFNVIINHLISIWFYLKDNGISTKDTHENIADQIPEFVMVTYIVYGSKQTTGFYRPVAVFLQARSKSMPEPAN